MAETALANAKGSITHRLARWLLMAHDRTAGDELRLTHEFLSAMLDVRRAGVTIALHDLDSRGLISITRKSIVIKSRAGLEAATDGLYGMAERELARLLVPLQRLNEL
jgi:CRP-like cAMP-binding protein